MTNLPTYRSRTGAIEAEQAALDDIARCSRALRKLKMLTIALQQYPTVVVWLDDLTQIIVAIKREAQIRQERASNQLKREQS